MAYAHEFRDVETGEPLGLIHRDVSPDNILVSRQGAVKVVDFGIAKVAGQGHRTLTGVVKGKVAYMPPEQLQAKAMDRRVDVYALGVVLYELLTGKRPFDATTDVSVMQAILFESFIPVSARRPDVPVALQQVLDKALAKDRERRYADCRALQDDLERFVLSTGEPVGAYQIAQRIAQWVPEVAAAPAMTPSQGAARERWRRRRRRMHGACPWCRRRWIRPRRRRRCPGRSLRLWRFRRIRRRQRRPCRLPSVAWCGRWSRAPPRSRTRFSRTRWS